MISLEVSGVTKNWGGNRALDSISFTLDCNVLGIVGPNGAGKTTLLNVIAGTTYPSEGKILFNGHDITRVRPWKRVHLGIGKTYQVARPFKTMTIEENVRLFTMVKDNVDVNEILRDTGLFDYKNVFPAQLPFGALKRLELAKILSTKPDILLLDEPFGGLSGEDIEEVSSLIIKLRDSGKRIIIIEHRISSLFALVDSVLFLDRGKKKFEGKVEDFMEDPTVRDAYLGGGDSA